MFSYPKAYLPEYFQRKEAYLAHSSRGSGGWCQFLSGIWKVLVHKGIMKAGRDPKVEIGIKRLLSGPCALFKTFYNNRSPDN